MSGYSDYTDYYSDNYTDNYSDNYTDNYTEENIDIYYDEDKYIDGSYNSDEIDFYNQSDDELDEDDCYHVPTCIKLLEEKYKKTKINIEPRKVKVITDVNSIKSPPKRIIVNRINPGDSKVDAAVKTISSMWKK